MTDLTETVTLFSAQEIHDNARCCSYGRCPCVAFGTIVIGKKEWNKRKQKKENVIKPRYYCENHIRKYISVYQQDLIQEADRLLKAISNEWKSLLQEQINSDLKKKIGV